MFAQTSFQEGRTPYIREEKYRKITEFFENMSRNKTTQLFYRSTSEMSVAA